MIPENDLGPAWLRDYGRTDYDDVGDIAADVHAMEELAARLQADVDSDYAPRATAVTESMMVRLGTDRDFTELGDFLHALGQAQDVTLQNVHNYANDTYGLAGAASEISARYRDADALVRGRVTGVRADLPGAGPADG